VPFGLPWSGLIGMFFTALSYAAMSRAFSRSRDPSMRTHTADCNEIAGFFFRLAHPSRLPFWCPSLLYLISAVGICARYSPGVSGHGAWLVGFISFNGVVNVLGNRASRAAASTATCWSWNW